MANSSISLKGIDQAIVDLNYRQGSVKQKAIMAIRSFYSSDESIKELNSIAGDTLIKLIWDVGDDFSKIKSKRRNFSSLRSSINTDLKKLLKKEKNPDNIILAGSNIFDLTQEAKENLLGSFSDAFKKGNIDLDQAATLLETMTEFLDKIGSEDQDASPQDIADKIKKILDKISKNNFFEDLDGNAEENAAEKGQKGQEGQEGQEESDLEKIELDEDDFEDIDELDEEEELEEIEALDGDVEPIELNEDEELEEIELDDDEEIEEVDELDEDEEMDKIELDEDEEIEEVDVEDDFVEDEEIEILDDELESVELDEDEEIEEIDDLDDEVEEIEFDEEEELEEVDELDEDEALDKIELDEDEEIEEVDVEDDFVEDEKVEALDDDVEQIELDEDEELEEIDDIEDEVEEIELDDDDELEEIEIDEDELLDEAETEEIGNDGSQKGEDLAKIDAIDEDLEEIELDEDEEIEELDDIEDEVEEIELDDDEQLEAVDELDEEEQKALEEFRKKRELSEQFDKVLGEREKKYNKYTKTPAGLYTVGTRKGLKSTLELQQFDMPEAYIGIYPVINSLFEIFIEETGYITNAEQKGFGRVYYSRFKKDSKGSTWNNNSGSKDVKGACWYQPTGPDSSLHGKRNHPVVQISVDDAFMFASWIGRRLPTEAEWESAARTDMGYKFPWGNEFNPKALNLEQSGLSDTNSVDDYDTFANEFKIIDMLGNVMEWTSDMEAPPFKSAKNIKYCVAKGGAWNAKDDVTISSRSLFKPGFTSNTIGFRCISEIFL